MASLLSSVTNAAHAAATNLLSAAQVEPETQKSHYGTGGLIPTAVTVKEDSADQTITLEGLTGRNIIVGVPGAFTGTCSRQIPQYIEAYEKFKEKGIKDIYVFAVNDIFVMKSFRAWKENMAPNGTPIRFIADDKGAFVGALGLLFDASPRLGSPRAKRFVLVTQDTTVEQVIIENATGELTVTAADKILALIS
ncbi:hypothetical protein EIP86_010366 [Pleurotus ostreatoroseus]|nr:hypothetical protein EIP86_010366 [Pleurotus ostreatoroseus]